MINFHFLGENANFHFLHKVQARFCVKLYKKTYVNVDGFCREFVWFLVAATGVSLKSSFVSVENAQNSPISSTF